MLRAQWDLTDYHFQDAAGKSLHMRYTLDNTIRAHEAYNET